MRTRPVIEIIAVLLLLVSAGFLISWSGSRAIPTQLVTVETPLEQLSVTPLDCEMRFAEEVDAIKLEQRVNDEWVAIFESKNPSSMLYERLELVGRGPLKVSISWPEHVGESMAELSLAYSGENPALFGIWGEGEHQELIELPDFGEREKE